MRNLLEPYVALRLVAGLTAALLFARAAATGLTVLRHFHVGRATEGQLLLERRLELAVTFVRVATAAQIACAVFSAAAAEHLRHGVRGAMCGYGVFQASPWGFPSITADVGAALLAGIVGQLVAFDARQRSFELARPVAIAAVALAPVAALDLGLAARFYLDLDLTVVASCCSVTLDAGAAAREAHAVAPREAATAAALVAVAAALAAGALATRRPDRRRVVAAGALSLAALPAAALAVLLEVAPHALEAPQHTCPFCLLRADVLGLGYPLFGALFVAAVWAAGAGLAALLARTPATRAALAEFAPPRLWVALFAWATTLALAVAPVARYALVSGFRPLFP